MQKPDWIAFDADDTLWVNEPFFYEAEKALERLLKPYSALEGEAFNRALYEVECRNLSLFGYGAKGFTLSMIETAIELSEGKITGAEIQEIIDQGKRVLEYPIQLLEGLPEVLDLLKIHFRLLVITKGDLFNQESKLARSNLASYFEIIEIVSEKDVATYRGIWEKHQLDPKKGLMVGNSLKSDILPVIDLGMQAVHVNQKTTWIHEQVETRGPPRWETLPSLKALPALLGL